MKYPFKQKKSNGLLIREFNKDVDSDELVWHRDRDDRYVTVNRGRGWKLQLENQLPVSLSPGKTYFIPAKTYHRVLKGQSNLVVAIKEGKKIKNKKAQFRKIIRESASLDEPFMWKDEAYTVIERKPSRHKGVQNGKPMELVIWKTLKPSTGTPGMGSMDIPQGMGLEEFFEAGEKQGFPDYYRKTETGADMNRAIKAAEDRGDWDDSRRNEGKIMKITKRQLRRIINESISIRNPKYIDDPDELNLQVAMKIKDMMPVEEVLRMSDANLKDLMIGVYEEHFDPENEGWDPHPEDISDVQDHLTVVPLPGDDDYDPDEHDRFYDFETEYDESGPYGTSYSFRKNEIRKRIKRVIQEVLEEDKSGKGKCPDSGCIKKSGDKWRIISNKTGKLWPQKYETRKKAESALDAYHASR